MRIAYFDLIGGASGDMILGALLDAGLAQGALRSELDALHLAGWSLETERVTRSGISATRAIVRAEEAAPARAFPEIAALLAQSKLSPPIRTASENILQRIATVEARIHNARLDETHLHELGGLDTIIDIVGAVAGLRRLGVEKVHCSPFPLARGLTETQHGVFPLPAPATVALIREKNAPIIGIEGNFETVTPTGAAILTTLAESFGALATMSLRGVGYGAGARESESRPNLLRVFLGETPAEQGDIRVETVTVIETNVDDMNPQFYDHVIARLFERGALDVTLSPIQMKKNRPGALLRVVCRAETAAELREILFEETTTLGIREQSVMRYALPREIVSVQTRFGILRAKIARRPDQSVTIAPEYDDCVRAANQFHVPLRQVWEEVLAKARESTR